MKTAKELAVLGMYTALLIGGQFVLSFLSGIEIVTILFLVFCYRFGVKRGIIVATAFSLLRCFVFGFMVNVIILYLVYYNLFAVIFGYLGNRWHNKVGIKELLLLTIIACFTTVLFSVIDAVVNFFYYSLTIKAVKTYFIATIPVMISQTICSAVTCICLLYPLSKLLKRVRI